MALPPPADDSLCVVTGASSGTGGALARGLAARGYSVAVVARRRERLEALAEELRTAHGVRVDVFPCDLSDAAARAQLVDDIQSDGRFVVGLCNDAGLGTFGRFQRLDLQRERQQVLVNVEAVFDLVSAFLPGMVARGQGAILNVGSLAGFQPLPGCVVYGATKAFVNSLSEGLHADLAGTGVSCSVLCPGPVRSGFFDSAGVPRWLGAGPKFLWATPEEMAENSIQAMLTGKRVVIPRFTWGVSAVGGRVAPRGALLPVVREVIDRWVAASHRA
jgi:short-subunit dehydrogenase